MSNISKCTHYSSPLLFFCLGIMSRLFTVPNILVNSKLYQALSTLLSNKHRNFTVYNDGKTSTYNANENQGIQTGVKNMVHIAHPKPIFQNACTQNKLSTTLYNINNRSDFYAAILDTLW